MTPEEIVRAAQQLSADERVQVVDSILETMDPPDPELLKRWTVIARERFDEIVSGNAETISGEEVFAEIRELFERG